MKFRIAMWGLVGFFVSACWVVYTFARATPISPLEPLVWNLATLSQPIVLASLHFHFGVSFYWVLLANAVTYGLLGLVVESIRRQVHPTA